MPVLADLLDALRTGRVEVVDLTAPLHSGTPILQLPPPFANTVAVRARGDQPLRRARPRLVLERHLTPASTPAPTSTRRCTGSPAGTARTSSQVPAAKLVAPAAVLDFSARGREGPRLPAGGRARPRLGGRARPAARRRLAALPHRLGRPLATTQAAFLNADETGPHTPGISVECARWLAEEAPVIGLGVETVGTDAGAAHSFDPAVPVPLLPARRRQVRADPAAEPRPAARRPARCVVAAPLPIVGGLRQPGAGAGAGRAVMTVAELVGAALAELGVGHAFGVVGSGNFHVTNALRRRRRPVRRGPARGRRGDDGRRLRADERAARAC